MDPHAAHERIGYERMGRISRESVTIRGCAVPLPVAPSFSQSVWEHRKGLEEIGFSFDERTPTPYLTAFPSLPGAWVKTCSGCCAPCFWNGRRTGRLPRGDIVEEAG